MKTEKLKASLGLTTAISLVMGSMIGSGIFITSADIGRTVDSPALLIAAWLITAFMTVIGALSYGELAAMMPEAGGQYVFLKESLGAFWGFLYGWTLFLVIQTATISAVAVAFGKFLGVFFPAVSAGRWIWHLGRVPAFSVGPMVLGNMEFGLNTQNGVAIAVIASLTAVNIFGVRLGAFLQNLFTISKTAALLGLIMVAFTVGRDPAAVAANFGDFWRNAGWGAHHAIVVGSGGATALVGLLTLLAVVQVGSLFSADAWNNVTFAAAEVKNPRRNLPLALAVGTGSVVLIYVLANFAYLAVLPLKEIQTALDDRVGTAVLAHVFRGAGAKLMAAAILISTFGCVNGMILAGSRVYYAMSEDGLFFKWVAAIHPEYKTPARSLLLQAAWALLLCLSGSYGQLLDYIMFAALLFYILTIIGLFVLRRTRPDAPRPYRAFGYPVLPALYVACAAWIDFVLLRYKPQYTWPGLILVLLGVPVYFIWAAKSSRGAGREYRSA